MEQLKFEEQQKAWRNFEKAYKEIIQHRSKCEKWKKQEMCIDCFGGGLTKFTEKIIGGERI